LNFNCSIGSLQYRRFKPRNVVGNLLIKSQMAVSRKLSFDAMGGSLTMDGIVDAKNPKAIDVVSGFKLNSVILTACFMYSKISSRTSSKTTPEGSGNGRDQYGDES